MKSTWTKGLTPERVKLITEDFNASGGLRERLAIILNEKIVTARKFTTAKELYQNPSWAYQQADAVGYERALNEIISLISSKSD